MMLLLALALASPPEQSLDRAQVEAAKLRQVLDVQRCADIAPCPRQRQCPDCELCEQCPTCPVPEPCIEPLPAVQPSKAIRYLFAAGGVVVGALVVGIIWSASP